MNNKCGYSMVVWKGVEPTDCSGETQKAQKVLDLQARKGGSPAEIAERAVEGKINLSKGRLSS